MLGYKHINCATQMVESKELPCLLIRIHRKHCASSLCFFFGAGQIFITAIKHQRINNLLFKANELSKLPTQTLKPYKTNYSHFFLFEVDSKNNDWMKKKLQQKLCCLWCSAFLTLFPRPIIPKNTSENTNEEQSKFEILHHPYKLIERIAFRWHFEMPPMNSRSGVFITRCDFSAVCSILFNPNVLLIWSVLFLTISCLLKTMKIYSIS